MRRHQEHPDQNFWEKIHKPNGESGCWEYTGCLNASGYGALLRRGILPDGKQSILAHRYSYMFLVGPIPDGMQLDHLCRNRKCCNPSHLEPVTNRQNVLRGKPGKGTYKTCDKGHKRNRHSMRCWAGSDGVIIVNCRDCEREYRERNREKIKSYLNTYHADYYKRKKVEV